VYRESRTEQDQYEQQCEQHNHDFRPS